MAESHCHHCDDSSEGVSVDRKLWITLLVFAAVLAASFLPVDFLKPLNRSLLEYIGMMWWAILLGLFLGGVIDYFVPTAFIGKYLGEKKVSSLFYAVVSGFLLSACSHGILALAIQLHKKGASNASVITFLLAAPWANLPVTLLLFSFFGWNAVLFVLSAMLIALVSGAIFIGLENHGLIEPSPDSDNAEEANWDKLKNFQLKESVVGVAKGSLQLSNMVLWWILIGVLFAAIIGAYVPKEIFMNYFGPSFTGLLLTLAIATIIEVCSEGSAPIAFEIYNKVGALGNPFIFLMAGVATDYTEIGLLWTNIGKKTAIWLPIVTVPQVVAVAYLMNVFL